MCERPVLIYTGTYRNIQTMNNDTNDKQRRNAAKKQNMSFRAQIAFGKNLTLQKQLDRKFADFKKNFKNSRRRHDALEEECVSSLYKLLLDSKSKQTERTNRIDSASTSRNSCKSTEPKRPHSVFELSDEKIHRDPRRCHTSMSVNSYTQSYSFKVDGMDIAKNRRDRFIQTRKEKRQEDHAVQIERRKRPGSSAEPEVEFETKMELLELPADEGQERPKSAEHKRSETPSMKSALKRPTTRTTLSPSQTSLYSSAAVTMEEQIKELGLQENINNIKHTAYSESPRRDVSSPTAPVIHVSPAQQNENDKSNIQARIKAFLANKSCSSTSHRDTFKYVANRNDDFETELPPLTEEEKRQLGGFDDQTQDNRGNQKSNLTRQQLNPSNDKLLVKSSEKTQSFLTEYAKKSKLFGYVVKTRASVVAPRDNSKKTYRSPAITYQELVSIKANIKQHETRTRLLLQKSAKLSRYVDDLVTAADLRQLKPVPV